MTDSRGRFRGVSRLDFLDWRDAARSFSRLAVLTAASLNVSEQGRPAEQYDGTYGSATLFELIGQRPQLGRDFTAADDTPGAEPVVIISDSVWKSRYAADRAVLGRAITVNDRVCTLRSCSPRSAGSCSPCSSGPTGATGDDRLDHARDDRGLARGLRVAGAPRDGSRSRQRAALRMIAG